MGRFQRLNFGQPSEDLKYGLFLWYFKVPFWSIIPTKWLKKHCNNSSKSLLRDDKRWQKCSFVSKLNLFISNAAKQFESWLFYHNQIDDTEIVLTLFTCWNHLLLPVSFWLTVKVKTRLSHVGKVAEKLHTCEEMYRLEDGKKTMSVY